MHLQFFMKKIPFSTIENFFPQNEIKNKCCILFYLLKLKRKSCGETTWQILYIVCKKK